MHSFARIYLHLVFSTRSREPALVDRVRPRLHGLIAKGLSEQGCRSIAIGSVEDHVHVLFSLGRDRAVSRVVERLKAISSRWLKGQEGMRASFAWQPGYGVFSVSASRIESVRRYVETQEEHHRRHTFEQEYIELARRHALDSAEPEP